MLPVQLKKQTLYIPAAGRRKPAPCMAIFEAQGLQGLERVLGT